MNYDYGHLGIIGTLKQLFGRGFDTQIKCSKTHTA